MKKVTVALAAVLSTAVWATPSRAGITTITYGITGGSVSGGDLDPGPISSGMFEVAYSADGLFTLLSGPAVLNSLTFQASGFSISGDFFTKVNLQLDSPVAGNGTPGTNFINTALVNLAGIANIHCYASAASCYDYGRLTPSVADNFLLMATGFAGAFSIAGPSGVANGVFSLPTFLTTLGNSTGTFVMSWTGTEVGRVFDPVPEPQTSTLLGLGLAVLAGCARQRSRGRRPA